jgi:prepilin-type processing-associated H-X9-DG protein
VLILPFLEQKNRYENFDLNAQFQTSSNSGGAAANKTQFAIPLSVYQCPSDPNSKSNVNNNNYFGVQGGGTTPNCSTQGGQRVHFRNGVLYVNSQTSFRDMTDGSTNVFAIGETKYCLTPSGRSDGYHVSWASSSELTQWSIPYTMAAAMQQINSESGDGATRDTINVQSRLFGSFHQGGCHFAMGDGSVQFISENVDLATYRTLAVRGDGLPIGGTL